MCYNAAVTQSKTHMLQRYILRFYPHGLCNNRWSAFFIGALMSKPFQFRGKWCIQYLTEDGKRRRKVLSADRDEAFEIYNRSIAPSIQASKELALHSLVSLAVSVDAVTKLAVKRIGDEQLLACVMKQLARVSNMCARHDMPDVPPPSNTARQVGRMPEFAGVYFHWNNGVVDYIGESACVPKRLKSHDVVKPLDLVSFIPCKDHRRAESFYIWLLNPPLNKRIRCDDTDMALG